MLLLEPAMRGPLPSLIAAGALLLMPTAVELLALLPLPLPLPLLLLAPTPQLL
jgi:hypothetical protein